jgi:hypothetical protein
MFAWQIHCKKVLSVTSRLGTGKSITIFDSVEDCVGR